MDFWIPPKPAIIRPAPAELRRDWGGPATKQANFFPGWFPAGAVAAGRITQLRFIQLATTSANSIAVPSGVRAGDLLIHMIASSVFGGAQTGVPSGFTLLTSTFAAIGGAITTSGKVAIGNESGTSLSGLGGSNTNETVLLHFRGDYRITALTSAQDETFDQGSGAPSAQSTITAGRSPTLALGYAWTSGTFVESGLSLTNFTGPNTAPLSIFTVAYFIRNSSNGTSTIQMADRGGGNAAGAYYLNLS